MPTPSPLTKLARSASTEEVIVSERLADLRSRVRMLTWVSGVCWILVVLLGGLLVTGTLDWLVHFDDSGTRLVFGLGLLGGAGWMFWRRLVAPLRERLSSSFLAGRVESRFPGLKNRVLSAVEFLEHRIDSKLGSAELQKVVIGQAILDLDRIEAADVVETKAVRSVTIASLFIFAIALTILVLHPVEAATSVQRLMFPFSNVPWPRAVELQLLRPDLSVMSQPTDEPIKIARGDTLELYVCNTRGRLPEHVWFEYRAGDDGQVVREPLRQTTVRDEKGRSRETAVISWVAVGGTMLFRACGGDDNVMPFRRVEVVPPPYIESLQVTVRPPAYSRRTVEQLPPGVGHVQGLLGTKVEVVATSHEALKSARLRIGDHPPAPIKIDDNGRTFTVSFEIQDALAGNYWFELTDRQGFTDREAVRYELRGIADGIPEVSIEEPVADILLTADAELPAKVLAKDDLGLREVRITYQVGDEETLRTIPLFNHTSQIADRQASDAPQDQQAVGSPLGPQRHEADYVWKMAELNPAPGTRIVFRAEATDDYDLSQPHLGKSVPRTITIVSREEKQKELATRVGDLLDDLRQAAQLQQRAMQQTVELQTQLEKVGELRPQDLDQLQRTELDQRQTASRLTQPSDGVASQAKQLLNEFRANNVNDAGTEQRLERLTNELGRLERDEFPEAERSLTRAQKLAERQQAENEDVAAGSQPDPEQNSTPSDSSSAKDKNPRSSRQQNSSSDEKSAPKNGGKAAQASKESTRSDENPGKSPPDSAAKGAQDNPKRSPDQQKAARPGKDSSSVEKSIEEALNEAQIQQSRSLETLQDLQDSLAEWRDRRDVSRDLSSVISEQEAVQKEATEMAQRTMTKSSAELTKQEKAELNKLAARQKKVADQLDQFRKQLEQTADSLQKNDPDAAGNLNDASQELKTQETSSKLQDAAQDIADNKMGTAAEAQQQALDELRDVERMVKRQGNEDTEQFLKQTQDALQEFQQLRQEQQDLADQAEELGKQGDSPEKQEQMQDLMEKQEELTERMAKAERKLERLRLHGPAAAANRARKRLSEMMKHMQDAGDDDGEMQQAMDEALDDLEQVERELVLEKRIAQERLAFEQLEKLEDELKALRAQQQTVIAETIRLEEAKGERESLTRGQLKTLKELADTERSLQHASEQLQQRMASADVFQLVLKRLTRALTVAGDKLAERDTSPVTQSFQQDAIRKIDSLLAVLKQEQKKQEKPNPAEKPEELANEPNEQEEKPEEAQPPGDVIPQLAQLKLLKTLQEEYLERTEQLEKFRGKDGKLPESMEAEKIELAREQVELADYARDLIAKFLQRQPERQEAHEGHPKPDAEPEGPTKKIDPQD